MTSLTYFIHVAAGAIALVSGFIALFTRKGGILHRRAGAVFVASMLVMAAFAACLAVMVPGQTVNLFIAAFVSYLVSTAWVTIRSREGAIGLAEKIALLVSLDLCAPFAVLSCQLALGLPPLFESAMPFKGPLLVAIYSFTFVLGMAAIGDARVVFGGGIRGSRRIARHLWRMLLGLTLATGSAFTNGLARLLPGPYHVPAAFFLPQFLPLALLLFWLIRVRLAAWRLR
jgi:uncharacterized membrane protein